MSVVSTHQKEIFGTVRDLLIKRCSFELIVSTSTDKQEALALLHSSTKKPFKIEKKGNILKIFFIDLEKIFQLYRSYDPVYLGNGFPEISEAYRRSENLSFCINNFKLFSEWVSFSTGLVLALVTFYFQQLERKIKFLNNRKTRYNKRNVNLQGYLKTFKGKIEEQIKDATSKIPEEFRTRIFFPNIITVNFSRNREKLMLMRDIFTYLQVYTATVVVHIARNSSMSDIELNPGPGGTTSAIENAFVAFGLEMAQPYAVESFRAQMKNCLECDIPNLSKKDIAFIEEMLGYSVNFSATGQPNTSEHIILAAFRNIARCGLKKQFNAQRSKLRTLFLGAAYREYNENKTNPNVVYQFYGSQTKDTARTILEFQDQFSNVLKGKTKTTNKKVFTSSDVKSRVSLKNYSTLKELTDDFVELSGFENRFFYDQDLPVANILMFEDSIYDMSKQDLINYFEKTGATMGHGYMMLPQEFIHDRVYDFDLFDLVEKKGKMQLLYRYGASNGYIHQKQNWRRIIDEPVITQTLFHAKPPGHMNKLKTAVRGLQPSGCGFNLVFEITARYGPFVTFSITRTNLKETIVRQIELPKQYRCIEVPDLISAYDSYHGKIRSSFTGKLKMIKVQHQEYNEIKNYLSAIAEKSLSIENIDAYMKKRIGGASLVDKALLNPWYLKDEDLVAVAFSILVFEIAKRRKKTAILDYFNQSWFSLFITSIMSLIKFVFTPLTLVFSWVVEFFNPKFLTDLINEQDDPSWVLRQSIETTPFSNKPTISLIPCFDPTTQTSSCPICMNLTSLGSQVVTCKHTANSKHTFKFTTESLKTLETKLIDNDSDPIGIKTVKERAKKNMPKNAFEWEVEVFLFSAGPGNGKSWMARQLLEKAYKNKTKALVLAPFTKLRSDYSEIVTKEGECYEVAFKTTHRGMEEVSYEELHVDEWTSFPYEFLAMIAYNNCAKRIYLYGDEKQTKLQEPTEGMYIGNHIDINLLSRHILHKNFRNPHDTVALLNKRYGYDSYAESKIKKSIEFKSLEQFNLDKQQGYNIMHFADETAKVFGIEENTVRRNQGQTCNVAGLVFSKHDFKLIEDEAMQIVALSRHKEKLFLYASPTCKIFQKFLALTGISEDYYELYSEFAVPALPKAQINDIDETEFERMFFPEQEKPAEQLQVENVGEDHTPSSSESLIADIKCDPALVETINILYSKLESLEDGLDDNHLEFFESTPEVLDILKGAFKDLYTGGTIADFGCGKGVIAKMLIQTFNVQVDGYDIKDRVGTFEHEQFTYFNANLSSKSFNKPYDFIISNMPFGAVHHNRKRARKFLDTMMRCSNRVLFINTKSFKKYLDKQDIAYTVVRDFDFRIGKTYKYQKKDYHDVPCSLYYIDFSSDFIFDTLVLDEDLNELVNLRTLKTQTFIESYKDMQFAGKLSYHMETLYKNIIKPQVEYIIFHSNGMHELFDKNSRFISILPLVIEKQKFNAGMNNLGNKIGQSDYNAVSEFFENVENNPPSLVQLDRDFGKYLKCKFCNSKRFVRNKRCRNVDCVNAERPMSLTAAVTTCEYCNDFKNFSHYSNECALTAMSVALKIPLGKLIQFCHRIVPCLRLRQGNFSANFIAEVMHHYNRRCVFVSEQDVAHVGYSNQHKVVFFFLNDSHWVYRPVAKTVLDQINLPPLREPNIDFEKLVGGRFVKTKLDDVSTFDNLKNFSATEVEAFKLHASAYHTFTNWTENTATRVEQPEVIQPTYQACYDAHLLPSIKNQILAEDNTSYNYYNGMKIQSDFQSGKINLDQYLAPLNKKGHPRKEKQFLSFGMGLGNNFSSAHNGQVLQVIQDRYIGSVKNFKLTLDGKILAERIAKNFYLQCIDERRVKAAFDEESIAKLSEQMLKDCYSKKYPEQFNIASEFSARNISFHLKEIFKSKISLKEEYTEKAGQGISAWSKPAQTTFMIGFRILNHVFLSGLKENIIFNNGYTIKDLSQRVDHIMASLPSDGILNATTDMTAFDKYQNSFTQQIEKCFWKLLGVCEEFIEHYYSFRHDYKIVCDIVTALVKSAKTSGEPATLINNTLLSLCLICWLFSGEGPMIIIAQGDDGFRRQANLIFLKQRYDELLLHVPLKIKCLISDAAEFCGYSIFKGALVPSLPRRLNKIYGQRFRDYFHFCEYQSAIRDFIEDTKFLDYFFIIKKNAEMWMTTLSEMQSIYDAIVAFSHLSKEQFFSLASLRTETYDIVNLYGR